MYPEKSLQKCLVEALNFVLNGDIQPPKNKK